MQQCQLGAEEMNSRLGGNTGIKRMSPNLRLDWQSDFNSCFMDGLYTVTLGDLCPEKVL